MQANNHGGVILTLVDLLPMVNQESSSSGVPIMTTFQQKLREKLHVPFSNNFDLIDTIDCRLYFGKVYEPVFDVQLSKYCSCLIALTRYSYLVIDQVTNYKSCVISHNKKVSYFTIEENYNGRGFDALLANDSGNVVKYDLREFIETSGNCKPLWKVVGSTGDRGINVMVLKGKRTVVVDNGSILKFYDSTDGTSLSEFNSSLNIEALNSTIGVDHVAENSFYIMNGRQIERFEYVINGDGDDDEWKSTVLKEDMECLVDVFVVDKISGLIYYFITQGYLVFKVVVLGRDGEVIVEKKLANGATGFCIDKCSGKMFVCNGSSIFVYQ